jgi:hypothetical protein
MAICHVGSWNLIFEILSKLDNRQSFDFNLIKNTASKLSANLLSIRERTVSGPREIIGFFVTVFNAQGYTTYFVS